MRNPWQEGKDSIDGFVICQRGSPDIATNLCNGPIKGWPALQYCISLSCCQARQLSCFYLHLLRRKCKKSTATLSGKQTQWGLAYGIRMFWSCCLRVRIWLATLARACKKSKHLTIYGIPAGRNETATSCRWLQVSLPNGGSKQPKD